jgi:GT2 family glycosyltransferase
MSFHPRLSLVLATIGRDAEVGRALQSFAAQTNRQFEVVVVDQNPDDRLVPYVRTATMSGIAIKHLRKATPGLSKARNLGLGEATGEFVAFPDDDCWYESDVIEDVLTAFDHRPGAAAVVGRWVEQAQGKNRDAYPFSLAAWRLFRGGDASSITLFLRRATLDQLGGFDARLGVGEWFGAAEETDLVLRALSNGMEIRHEPTIRVHHLFSEEPVGSIPALCRSARNRARGTGAIYAKHNLSWLVVIRGIVAPLLWPLSRRMSLKTWRLGAATSLGRIEGLVAWRRLPPQIGRQ